ncbi:MAG TPA: hypothetical protein VMG12_33930 [Polyangiaceae bacterium]|nr:hypothetical protein [Polyangiaceae bacterium]
MRRINQPSAGLRWRWAFSLGAFAVIGACLNPLPEEFPSDIDGPVGAAGSSTQGNAGSGGASASGGSSAGTGNGVSDGGSAGAAGAAGAAGSGSLPGSDGPDDAGPDAGTTPPTDGGVEVGDGGS